MILQTLGDTAGSQRDLTGNEVLAAALRLMVEQDAVDGKHAVSIAVLLDHPETILLCDSVRRVGMERGGLTLGNLLDFAVQLRGRSLIHLAGLRQPADADSLQHTQNAQRVYIAGIFRRIEGNLDMALRSQIVDFIGFDFAHQTDQTRRIGQVSVVQGNRVLLNQMVNTSRVGDGSTADDAVDFIALLQQKLCQIGTILPSDTRDKCLFHVFYSSLTFDGLCFILSHTCILSIMSYSLKC